MRITKVDDPELAAQMQREFARHRENDDALLREWDRLRAEHPGEWAIAHSGGCIEVAVTLEAAGRVHDRLPDDERGSAVIRHIVAEDRILNL